MFPSFNGDDDDVIAATIYLCAGTRLGNLHTLSSLNLITILINHLR